MHVAIPLLIAFRVMSKSLEVLYAQAEDRIRLSSTSSMPWSWEFYSDPHSHPYHQPSSAFTRLPLMGVRQNLSHLSRFLSLLGQASEDHEILFGIEVYFMPAKYGSFHLFLLLAES